MRYYLVVLSVVALALIPWVDQTYPGQWGVFWSDIGNFKDQVAAVILSHHPKTVADIQGKYVADPLPQSPKVHILIVPGHEPDFGGAEYKALKERDMNVELADDLQSFLDSDPHYATSITRDSQQWMPDFAAYFKNGWNDIIEWQKASHAEQSSLIKIGKEPAPVSKVYHNSAPEDVALRLYGITKWANENDIDITVHIHFNDDPGRHADQPGKYSGFAIYVPASQYGNSSTTKAVANTVFKRLQKYNAVSDLPGESTGLVDEPDLIAIGADNTADSASMLIEYGYIYEQQFQDPAVRSVVLKDLAYQTYLGLKDFFDPVAAADLAKSYDTLVLPHSWTDTITAKGQISPDIFAMQTALQIDGDYPPSDMSLNDCPRTGKLGPCTQSALSEFQKKYDITGEKGIAGDGTIKMLNKLYSPDMVSIH